MSRATESVSMHVRIDEETQKVRRDLRGLTASVARLSYYLNAGSSGVTKKSAAIECARIARDLNVLAGVEGWKDADLRQLITGRGPLDPPPSFKSVGLPDPTGRER